LLLPALAAAEKTCAVAVELSTNVAVASVETDNADKAEAEAGAEACAKLKATTQLDCADPKTTRVWKARSSLTVTMTNGEKTTKAQAEVHAAAIKVAEGRGHRRDPRAGLQIGSRRGVREAGPCPTRGRG
jgi:hypothetical protein